MRTGKLGRRGKSEQSADTHTHTVALLAWRITAKGRKEGSETNFAANLLISGSSSSSSDSLAFVGVVVAKGNRLPRFGRTAVRGLGGAG